MRRGARDRKRDGRGALSWALAAVAAGLVLLLSQRLEAPAGGETALAPFRPDAAPEPAAALRAPAGGAQAERASAASAGGEARTGPAGGPAGPAAAEPRTEKDYYERFMALARAKSADFDRELRRALAEEGPACRKVAALRAAWDGDHPGLSELFLEAVGSQPDVSEPQGESIPSFLVRFLGDRAGREERARTMLERIARDGTLEVPTRLRERALGRLERIRDEYEQGHLSS